MFDRHTILVKERKLMARFNLSVLADNESFSDDSSASDSFRFELHKEQSSFIIKFIQFFYYHIFSVRINSSLHLENLTNWCSQIL